MRIQKGTQPIIGAFTSCTICYFQFESQLAAKKHIWSHSQLLSFLNNPFSQQQHKSYVK